MLENKLKIEGYPIWHNLMHMIQPKFSKSTAWINLKVKKKYICFSTTRLKNLQSSTTFFICVLFLINYARYYALSYI